MNETPERPWNTPDYIRVYWNSIRDGGLSNDQEFALEDIDVLLAEIDRLNKVIAKLREGRDE